MSDYVKAVRLPFLTGSLTPVVLAASQAYTQGFFAGLELVLVLIGVGFLHLAANLINDFFDARGSDPINIRITPFSGGSRVIQEQKLSSRTVLIMAVVFFGLAVLAGLVLMFRGHVQVAWIGLLGLAAGLLYSANPVQFMSRGLGELSIFLAFGPLITLGTGYVMTGALTWQAFFLGFPLGFLIAAVIWINQFPDYPADRDAGKRNLVVRMGLTASRWVYLGLMGLPFPFLVYLILFQGISGFILLGWLAFPLALKGMGLFWRHYANHEQLVPAQALTIQTHLALGLLMTIGIVAGYVVGQ